MRGRRGEEGAIRYPWVAPRDARASYPKDIISVVNGYKAGWRTAADSGRVTEAGTTSKPEASLFFLGLFLGRGKAFQSLEQLFFGHPVDGDLGVVGIHRAAGRTDQRRRLG